MFVVLDIFPDFKEYHHMQ